jgi:ATP-dependent RNA helicase DBP3
MASDGEVLKAARKALKRQDSGQIKLKELAKRVATAVDSDVSVSQIKKTIRDSPRFAIDGQLVKLSKKRPLPQDESPKFAIDGKLAKRSKKIPLQQDEEATHSSAPLQAKMAAKSPKTSKTTSGAVMTSTAVSAWRLEHKIVILHAQDDDNGRLASAKLQINDAFFPWSSFSEIQTIHAGLIRHCTVESKFTTPSPIQAQSWPILTAHRDMVGIAETGSGKTLAFGLPALSALAAPETNRPRGPRLLVLAPTRELAMQSAAVLQEFGAVVGLQSLTIYGGVPKHTQVTALKQGRADCVVATPGRLKDLLQEKSCHLGSVRHLVLDEADRMLDCGFEEDIRYIIRHCTHVSRQTAMFSATWPAAIQAIALEYMQNPIRVYVGFESIVGTASSNADDSAMVSVAGMDDSLSANKRVQQIIEVLEDRQREARLREVLKIVHSGAKKMDRVLVFALYKIEAERLEQALRRDGWHCSSIHGNKNQQARTTALSDFKSGSCPLLIATDVAARGLDIPNVEAVINYTFPLTIEDYVHRIGRTGRAGKSGISYTFFQPGDKSHAGALQQVLKQVGQPIPDALAKFGNTIKKKEHKMYGNFGPKNGITKQATKITFNYDE